MVTVDGAGSTWTNSGILYVGNYGSGTLIITDGGTVSSGYGYIGYVGIPARRARSRWTAPARPGPTAATSTSATPAAGRSTITSGGTVSNTDGYIGYNSARRAW